MLPTAPPYLVVEHGEGVWEGENTEKFLEDPKEPLYGVEFNVEEEKCDG